MQKNLHICQVNINLALVICICLLSFCLCLGLLMLCSSLYLCSSSYPLLQLCLIVALWFLRQPWRVPSLLLSEHHLRGVGLKQAAGAVFPACFRTVDSSLGPAVSTIFLLPFSSCFMTRISIIVQHYESITPRSALVTHQLPQPILYQSPAVMSSVRPRNFKMKLSGVGLWARLVLTISIAVYLVTWTRRPASGSWVRVAVPVSSNAACLTQCRAWNLLHRRMYRVRTSPVLMHFFVSKEAHVSDSVFVYISWPSMSLCPNSCVWSEVVHSAEHHTSSLQDRGWLPCSSRQLALAGQPAARWWSNVRRSPGRQLLGGHCCTLLCWVSVFVCMYIIVFCS